MNYKTLTIFLGLIAFGLVVSLLLGVGESQFGYSGSTVNSYDTTSAGFTSSTSTVNTTTTQVFATVSRVSYLINNTAATLTCELEASNTTVASSTLVSGRGVIVGNNNSSSMPGVVAFGNCDGVGVTCFRHSGAVNCLGSSAVTVTKLVQ